MIYAVVKVSGKQRRLQEQDKIMVDKLPLQEKETYNIDQVLLLRNQNKVLIGDPFVENVVVQTKVLEQIRDKKIIVFKKKRRKGYKKTQGHRQYKTVLLVEKILLKGTPLTQAENKTSAKKETAKPKEEVKPKEKAAESLKQKE